MKFNPVRSITRAATRKAGEKLNILTIPTHERYESGLAMTGHNFYAIQKNGNGFKDWKEVYAEKPNNYHLLDKSESGMDLPVHLDFDLVLSQNKFGQFQHLSKIANILHLPLISLEHTLPAPFWGPEYKIATGRMRGQMNVFISDYSLEKWEWQDLGDTTVVGHMVDTDLFKDNRLKRNPRQNKILTVANDYIGRDWCLDFQRYKRICLDKGLPVTPVGDTPGLSKAADDIYDLVDYYCCNRIFLNTAHVSPIPTSLLEAMSCGCAVVSCATCAIPEYIQHGINGFLYNTDEEMNHYLNLLLNDENLANRLGEAARKTIIEKCNPINFIKSWNETFEFTVQKGYL